MFNMKKDMKPSAKIIAAILVAAAVVTSAIVVGTAYTYKYRVQNTVTVTGLGETEFSSDMAVLRGTITVDDLDAVKGYARIEENKGMVSQFIISRGIAPEAVEFGFVNVVKTYEPIYAANGNYAGQRFTGNRLSQEFTIESTDMEAFETLLGEFSSLIAQGVQMDLWQPAYYYSGLEGLKLDVIEQATLNARERAERVAEQSGCRLGNVKNARIGVFQITGVNTDEEFTAGGTLNTSSRLKKARITVTVEYRVR